jgi:glycerol-3-phosphate cytidylyltransferase
MTTAITFGAYDLFHIGHLNLLRNARAQCDRLIVGIATDERILRYKNKRPIFPDKERLEIVRSCRFVDDVFLNGDDPSSLESYVKWVRQFSARKIFIGSDWQGTDKYGSIGTLLQELNCELIYLPHTDGVSTTDIVKRILDTGHNRN